MFRSRIRIRHTPLGLIVLALPLAVELDVPSDSSVTQFRVAGGGGHYLAVARDCNGNALDKADDSFYDIAASVDHKFAGSPLSLGVSGGHLHDGRLGLDASYTRVISRGPDEGYYYVSPSIGLMGRRFGFSMGATYFSQQLINPDDVDSNDLNGSEWLPSIAIRIGSTSGLYGTVSILSAFPFYSGGGYFEIGLGGPVSDNVSLWGGVNLAGLTASGLQARIQWRLASQLYLDTGASLGSREGETQYGGSIGLTYRVVH